MRTASTGAAGRFGFAGAVAGFAVGLFVIGAVPAGSFEGEA